MRFLLVSTEQPTVKKSIDIPDRPCQGYTKSKEGKTNKIKKEEI